MEITKLESISEWILSVSGRIDTSSAPQLETEIKNMPSEITSLILDFASLDYISSAGLRVLLSTQKQMKKTGKLTIRNVNETVMEILTVTGFNDFLNIE